MCGILGILCLVKFFCIKIYYWVLKINPLLVDLSNSIFHPLEVVFRYRDTQLHVGENYSNIHDLNPNISYSSKLKTH